MSNAFAATARAYRAAIRRHEWPDNAERILREILFYSYDHGRYRALIPTQVLFKELCGRMSKGKVSDCLSWLEEMRVIQRESVPVSYGGRRRRWTVYSLLPPDQWAAALKLRVPDTARERDVASWLAELDPEQPELIAPPATLNDLLIEDFVERAGVSLPGTGHGGPSLPQGGDGARRVESGSQAQPGEPIGSPGRNFGGVESKSKSSVSHGPMVPLEGTNVETEAFAPEKAAEVLSGGTALVPPQGTSQVPLQGTSPIGSPAGNLSGSSTGNLVGGRGASNRSTRIDKSGTFNSNRVHRIERARAEVPSQGTSQVPLQGTLPDFLTDPYVREKLSRMPALSRELVDGINLQGRYSLLKQQFGELYRQDANQARELLSISITKNNPNGWLNRSVRVGLKMEPLPQRES